MKPFRTQDLSPLAAALISLAVVLLGLWWGRAHAQTQQYTNLSWRPASTSARWNGGSWQPVTNTSLVICGATASANESSAPIVQFQNCSTYVYACTVPQTIGVQLYCPPGSFSGERFISRSQVYGAPAACPPQPPDETRPQVCPAGTLGQWTQTRTYSQVPAPECWRANAWLPADPPAGACPTIPPLAIANFTLTPNSFGPNGGTGALAWSATATDGCTLNNLAVPTTSSRPEVFDATSPEWTHYTLICRQEGSIVSQLVRAHVNKPATCYPLSDVPPENWNPITGSRLVWYGSDILPRGWVARWSCRQPDDTFKSYCVGSRFEDLDDDAEDVKNGDKIRKDQAWNAASWRPLTLEEQAACDALKAAQEAP